MKEPAEEHALLVEGINTVELGMLKSLLASEGIPCLDRGPDFDVIELGSAHNMLRGVKLYVPREALERARELLAEANWGGQPGDDATDQPSGSAPEERAPK